MVQDYEGFLSKKQNDIRGVCQSPVLKKELYDPKKERFGHN